MIQSRSGSHDLVVATIKKMPFPLNNREFVGRNLCAADTNGDLLITAVPVDDVVDYGMSTRTVRGVARAFMRITPSGESQCKVTYIQYLDAGGVIPTRVVESKIRLALSAVSEMRDEFQRDDEIDKMERDELARVMKDEQQVYSEDEHSLIQRVQDRLGAIKEEDFEELGSPDHHMQMLMSMNTESDGIMRGIATLDTSIEVCAAWERAVTSRKMVDAHAKGGGLARELREVNAHSHLFHVVYDLKIPAFKPREFLLSRVWRRQGGALQVASEEVMSVTTVGTREDSS